MKILTEEDSQKYFIDEFDQVWKAIGYAAEPTMTFEKVSDGTREHHVVTSMNIQKFKRLIVEGEE